MSKKDDSNLSSKEEDGCLQLIGVVLGVFILPWFLPFLVQILLFVVIAVVVIAGSWLVIAFLFCLYPFNLK